MAGSGVEVRHGTKCATRKRKACDCRPSVRAKVKVNGEIVRKSFNERGGNLNTRVAAATKWKNDAEVMIRNGTFRLASGATIKGLMTQFLDGAAAGTILTRNGREYAPSTLRRMRQAATFRIIPAWGDRDPDTLTSASIERFVEDLKAAKLSASSIQNTIKPLSAMYRWAMRTNRANHNPTIGVLLPGGGRTRDRIATPDEAAQLLAELSDEDRVLWAIAFYGGLRRSEVLGLEWTGLDRNQRVIRVRKTYHIETKTVRPIGKTKAARRTVPMPSLLATELARHELRCGSRDGFVFGGDTPGMPHWSMFLLRAYRAWKKAKLTKLCFHEARHTYASWIIAAAIRSGESVDWKELAGLMGHSNVATTIDTYQKLMPDNVERAGRRLDTFLSEYGNDVAEAG